MGVMNVITAVMWVWLSYRVFSGADFPDWWLGLALLLLAFRHLSDGIKEFVGEP